MAINCPICGGDQFKVFSEKIVTIEDNIIPSVEGSTVTQISCTTHMCWHIVYSEDKGWHPWKRFESKDKIRYRSVLASKATHKENPIELIKSASKEDIMEALKALGVVEDNQDN